MKKVILFYTFLSIYCFSYSQDNIFCDTEVRTNYFSNLGNRTDEISYVEWNNVTLPVIVHIFHNGEDIGTFPNLSDEVVHLGINISNDTFSGYYSSTMNDSNIKFCIPDSNEMYDYSIVRYNADTLDWVGPWDVGFLDFPVHEFHENCINNLAIDYENHINIFVAPFVSGTKGRSWMDWNTGYGGILITTAFYVYEDDNYLSRTLTHEFGHYLGLSHTFTYDNCDEVYDEFNCENEGDYVCDTPASHFYTCFDHECYGNGSSEHNTLKTNFMGYTIGCGENFTDGQIDRMHYFIQNTALSGIADNICSCTSIDNYDCVCSDECFYDLNNDGIVGMQDLLDFLGFIFNEYDCNYGDFDNSGYVDTLDLLELLSNMGSICI